MSDDLFPPEPTLDETIACDDLDRELSTLTDEEGYRLFSIFPADSPREAVLEKDRRFIRLISRNSPSAHPEGHETPTVITRRKDSVWHPGRAGMEYRDLVPGRLGGKLIASHIRIPAGGPVPDYVHFHNVDFQVICCIKGWCSLVYEDQGEPFRFEAGDSVLQPPGIRHRVLECSEAFEVIEISSPAEHPTYAEHGFSLPSEIIDRDKAYRGQKFVHSRSREADIDHRADGINVIETGIGDASGGAVDLAHIMFREPLAGSFPLPDKGKMFVYVIDGSAEISGSSGTISLFRGDSLVDLCVGGEIRAAGQTELLAFRLH